MIAAGEGASAGAAGAGAGVAGTDMGVAVMNASAGGHAGVDVAAMAVSVRVGVTGESAGAAAIVDLHRVTRAFAGRSGVTALSEADLRVASGDHLAITGPSGAGKSTMLNILGLLDRPTTGEYLFDGEPTSRLSERRRSELRATQIGFVFQSFHLLPARTVLENVLLAFLYGTVPHPERRERAEHALERVGLSHRSDFRPGFLSGGERQRAAIARAVCTRPRLLLADEPTGNLDRANSEAILDLFDQLNDDGLTLVTITHDQRVADRARRRIRIERGRLTELRP